MLLILISILASDRAAVGCEARGKIPVGFAGKLETIALPYVADQRHLRAPCLHPRIGGRSDR